MSTDFTITADTSIYPYSNTTSIAIPDTNNYSLNYSGYNSSYKNLTFNWFDNLIKFIVITSDYKITENQITIQFNKSYKYDTYILKLIILDKTIEHELTIDSSFSLDQFVTKTFISNEQFKLKIKMLLTLGE